MVFHILIEIEGATYIESDIDNKRKVITEFIKPYLFTNNFVVSGEVVNPKHLSVFKIYRSFMPLKDIERALNIANISLRSYTKYEILTSNKFTELQEATNELMNEVQNSLTESEQAIIRNLPKDLINIKEDLTIDINSNLKDGAERISDRLTFSDIIKQQEATMEKINVRKQVKNAFSFPEELLTEKGRFVDEGDSPFLPDEHTRKEHRPSNRDSVYDSFMKDKGGSTLAGQSMGYRGNQSPSNYTDLILENEFGKNPEQLMKGLTQEELAILNERRANEMLVGDEYTEPNHNPHNYPVTSRSSNPMTAYNDEYKFNNDSLRKADPDKQLDFDVKNGIFIAHGENIGFLNRVKEALVKFGFKPITFKYQHTATSTTLALIEKYRHVQVALILYTESDFLSKTNPGSTNNEAIKDALFTHGFLQGRLSNKNIISIINGSENLLPLLPAKEAIYFTSNKEWMIELVKTFIKRGYQLDLKKLLFEI